MTMKKSFFQTKLPFLVTPFLTSRVAKDRTLKKFNDIFCPARSYVEQAIGAWKKMFPPLLDGLNFESVEVNAKCIVVLAAVYNYILENDGLDEDIIPDYKDIKTDCDCQDIQEKVGTATNIKIFNKHKSHFQK